MKPKKLKECVAPEPKPLKPATSVQEAGETMRNLDADKFPVAEKGKLVGLVPDRMADRRTAGFGHDPKIVPIRESMSAEKIFCRADQTVEEARQLMKQHGLSYLPVVDSRMRLVGVVSLKALRAAEGKSKPKKK